MTAFPAASCQVAGTFFVMVGTLSSFVVVGTFFIVVGTFFVVVGFSFEAACDRVPTEVDIKVFAVGAVRVFRLLAMSMGRSRLS